MKAAMYEADMSVINIQVIFVFKILFYWEELFKIIHS